MTGSSLVANESWAGNLMSFDILFYQGSDISHFSAAERYRRKASLRLDDANLALIPS